MHAADNNTSRKFWSPRKLDEGLNKLLETLEKSLTKGKLPHFHNKNVNILDGISRESQDQIDYATFEKIQAFEKQSLKREILSSNHSGRKDFGNCTT